LESKTTIPHYYLETDIRMDELIKMREELIKAVSTPSNPFKISFNDVFVKAAALASIDVPEVNS